MWQTLPDSVKLLEACSILFAGALKRCAQSFILFTFSYNISFFFSILRPIYDTRCTVELSSRCSYSSCLDRLGPRIRCSTSSLCRFLHRISTSKVADKWPAQTFWAAIFLTATTGLHTELHRKKTRKYDSGSPDHMVHQRQLPNYAPAWEIRGLKCGRLTIGRESFGGSGREKISTQLRESKTFG